MKWSDFFTSSVGKKFVMALSGLFLISFLVVHVGINACIYADLLDDSDNGEIFNIAAHFMGAYYVIRILEVGLFVGFFIHIIQGYVLEAKNMSRRKTGYQVPMGSKGSRWYRKSMGLLGTLILLFLIIHISHFWVPSRITHTLEPVRYGGAPVEYPSRASAATSRMPPVLHNSMELRSAARRVCSVCRSYRFIGLRPHCSSFRRRSTNGQNCECIKTFRTLPAESV